MNHIELKIEDASLEELLAAVDRNQATLESKKSQLGSLEEDCYDLRKGISKLNQHIADLGVAIARKTLVDKTQPEEVE